MNIIEQKIEQIRAEREAAERDRLATIERRKQAYRQFVDDWLKRISAPLLAQGLTVIGEIKRSDPDASRIWFEVVWHSEKGGVAVNCCSHQQLRYYDDQWSLAGSRSPFTVNLQNPCQIAEESELVEAIATRIAKKYLEAESGPMPV